MSWYQWKRRQLIGIAVATAAGVAAAYYAYSWYTSPPAAAPDHNREVAAGDSDKSGHDKLAQQLKAHMASLQSIADKQTMPDMRDRLLLRIAELSGVDGIRSELQALRDPVGSAAGGEDGRAQKLALWTELRDRSVWKLCVTIWLLPALTLLVHIQVTVLGRHMYLEQMLRDDPGTARPPAAAATRAPPRLWPLTAAQQEAFMSYSAFVLHDGLQQLLPALLPIVREQMQHVALTDGVSVDQIWLILSSVHAAIDDRMDAAAWAEAMLPPVQVRSSPPLLHSQAAEASTEESLGPAAFSVHRAAHRAQQSEAEEAVAAAHGCTFPPCFVPSGVNPVEAAVVAELVHEAASVLRSETFHSTLRAAVKFCAGCAAEEAEASITRSLADSAGGGDGRIAVPRVVPLLANVPRDMLSRCDGEGVCSGLLALDEVQGLLEEVYACGPFLDQRP